MSEIRENLRNNLARYLSEKKISQKVFAEQLEVSPSAVTNWIKGKNSPDIEIVARICSILGVSVIDLFGDVGSGQRSQIQEDPQKKQLIENYENLNDEGKKKLVEYSDDLVDVGKYKKTATKQSPPQTMMETAIEIANLPDNVAFLKDYDAIKQNKR